jgi:exopolyphosphatase / guanosine-5'-triphosphate,3'-diphosphate pyrophosphatase
MIQAGHSDRIDLAGLSERRRPVIAGGLLILEAVMQTLAIEQLQVSPFALREGLLHDLMGRLEQRDPRERSVRRWPSVTRSTAARPSASMTGPRWPSSKSPKTGNGDRFMPTCCTGPASCMKSAWPSRTMPIPQHTAYILEHADLAGFSRQEQQFMATIARLQRGRIQPVI